MSEHAGADGEGQVDRVCHEEQMTIWTGEIAGSLSMGGYLREDLSYDEKLELHAVIAGDLRSIVGSALTHPEFSEVEAPNPSEIPTLKAEIERLKAERDEAAADRDALLGAIGFKPGLLGDGLRRKVILDDAGGLRGAMVKARRKAADVQCDADLWTMRMLEGWPGDTLLLRLWRQRRDAVRRAKAAEAALAESERKRVKERAALTALYAWYDRDGSVGGASDVFSEHRHLIASIKESENGTL